MSLSKLTTATASKMPKGIGYKRGRKRMMSMMTKKEAQSLGKPKRKDAKGLLSAFAEEVQKDRKLRQARNSGRGLTGRTRKRFTRSLNKNIQGGGNK